MISVDVQRERARKRERKLHSLHSFDIS